MYQYASLPMGLSNSPDIFQAVMNDVLDDLDNTRAHLDDVLITTSGSYDDHLRHVEKALSRLAEFGFRVNLRKSFFAASEIEYLGYWVTRDGISPQPKKVEAIMRLQPPKTKRQLRHFLGMINYYRDMWKRRSHILAPLSGLVSKTVKWDWTKECQEAFEEIKKTMAKETLLTYPDFNKTFHVYADASDKQLGGVIMQEGKPLAFYSRKLNSAQCNYAVGEKELLSIVEALKEFKGILLGHKIVVHTDHKNILYRPFPSDRIMRWRLMIEEYGAEFVHIKGEENVVADGMSRLHHESTYFLVTQNTDDQIETSWEEIFATSPKELDKEAEFPLLPSLIDKYQKKDKKLMKRLKEKSNDFSTINVEGHELLARHGKIYIPDCLQGRVLSWYHEYLVHPGATRTEATIRQQFTWPGLTEDVRKFVQSCGCQKHKRNAKKYGKLPVRQVETVPWKRVDVDLIGPWTVKTPSKTYSLQAITMIDPATGWFEMSQLIDATAYTAMNAFCNEWLCRYPRPKYVGMDGGSEFKKQFKETVKNYGLKVKKTTPYNPQGNSVIERIHQVIGDSLRAYELQEQELDEDDPFGAILANVSWALRSTYHTALEATPGQLFFGRDMLLGIQHKANWTRIAQRRQEQANCNNKRENAKRIPHTYKVGDYVLLKRGEKVSKMTSPNTGPYEVISVHANGTVRIQKGAVSQRINIRRIIPYRGHRTQTVN